MQRDNSLGKFNNGLMGTINQQSSQGELIMSEKDSKEIGVPREERQPSVVQTHTSATKLRNYGLQERHIHHEVVSGKSVTSLNTKQSKREEIIRIYQDDQRKGPQIKFKKLTTHNQLARQSSEGMKFGQGVYRQISQEEPHALRESGGKLFAQSQASYQNAENQMTITDTIQ